MNHRELLGKILAEVRKVNEQWYEILMLLCVEQCTYEETAQRLGISVMVLRARLYRRGHTSESITEQNIGKAKRSGID